MSLRVIYHYGLAQAVPTEGTASYDEIAEKSGLIKPLLFRILRCAMSNGIFDEDDNGRVRHTAASRAIATNEGFRALLGLELVELGPASTKQIQTWEKYGQDVGEPTQSAFSMYNETDQSLYGVLAADPERAKRFDAAMRFSTKDESWDLRHMLRAFDWASLDKPGNRLVDIGGGYGHFSQFIAKETTDLAFTVQDLPHVVGPAPEQLPEEFKGRIEFQVQDFMTPQSADNPPAAFLVSRCTHNWSDKYAVQLLQNLIPALRPGSKILLVEYVLDDKPITNLTDRSGLQLDLVMATVLNAQERYAWDFKKLLAEADERFVLEGIRKPEGSKMSLMEVTWKG